MTAATVSAAELAHRVRLRGVHCTETMARSFLRDFEQRAICERVYNNRYRLTAHGRQRFGAWGAAVHVDDEDVAK